jgi:hypothetical protein
MIRKANAIERQFCSPVFLAVSPKASQIRIPIWQSTFRTSLTTRTDIRIHPNLQLAPMSRLRPSQRTFLC